jgi:seryl-tRNA synthetase
MNRMSLAFDDPISSWASALFCPLGVEGVYARTALFERVIEGLGKWISRLREPGTEALRFPPVMSRKQLEKTGYQNNFPQLLAGVCCLDQHQIGASAGKPESNGMDWAAAVSTSDLVVTPAACYPVYPIVGARGEVPAAGLLFDVSADCFRREPSRQLDRLQSFRMREFVCVGTAEQAAAFRARWLARAEELAHQLGLAHRVEKASDPFFGRTGQLLALSQVEQSLKFELLIPIYSQERPTACMSFNCHLDHFGETWELKGAGNAPVHTACVAFGLDRLALALFVTHGVDLERWPAATRDALAA